MSPLAPGSSGRSSFLLKELQLSQKNRGQTNCASTHIKTANDGLHQPSTQIHFKNTVCPAAGERLRPAGQAERDTARRTTEKSSAFLGTYRCCRPYPAVKTWPGLVFDVRFCPLHVARAPQLLSVSRCTLVAVGRRQPAAGGGEDSSNQRPPHIDE